MKAWFFIFLLLGLGMVAARAMSPNDQIIIFGGAATSASGSSSLPCGTGVIDLSTGCSLPIALGLVP